MMEGPYVKKISSIKEIKGTKMEKLLSLEEIKNVIYSVLKLFWSFSISCLTVMHLTILKVKTNEQMESIFFCEAMKVTSGCNKVFNFICRNHSKIGMTTISICSHLTN